MSPGQPHTPRGPEVPVLPLSPLKPRPGCPGGPHIPLGPTKSSVVKLHRDISEVIHKTTATSTLSSLSNYKVQLFHIKSLTL